MNFSSIDIDTRKRIEKSRLERLIRTKARAATDAEMARLWKMVHAIDPQARDTNNPFVGMHAVTLDRSNLDQLDRDGIASLKADGLHAHAAFVNCDQSELQGGERRDTVLFVLRGASGALPQVFAVDCVYQRTFTPVLLDGELCLRKRHLSPEEFLAINSGQNVHTRPYLQYPVAADAQAYADGVDVTGDEYQSVYDAHFELVYAAFDCMYLLRKAQVSRPYTERIALVRNLTEASPVADQTKRYRACVDQMSTAVQYAGGAEQFALRMFMKPMFAMAHTAAAMHAVPTCMRGIAIDGVIFNTATDTYHVGTNPRLLKWKPEHTADLVLVREQTATEMLSESYTLCAQRAGRLMSVTDNILLDTPNARQLAARYAVDLNAAVGATVLECVGVRVQTPMIDDGVHVFWRPVHPRPEKQLPNSLATFNNVMTAVAAPIDQARIVATLAAQQ